MRPASATRRLARASLISLPVTAFVACGASEDPVSPAREGRFLDSAVSGLAYSTPTTEGKTGVDGAFAYQAGETIVFSIGDVRLPEIVAAPLLTPVEVFASLDDPARSTAVANLARLLQTLDVDGMPTNGIELAADASLSATGLVIDFAADDFDDRVGNLVANGGSGAATLVTADRAVAHLNATREANGLGMSGCGSTHPLVGRTAAFETFFHGVAGTLEVIDDCTIEVRDFDYDGQGPDVFFHASRARAYEASDAFIIGPRLDGTVWQGDVLTLTIPEGQSLDTFDSLSVWCFDFAINFGDVFFGDT